MIGRRLANAVTDKVGHWSGDPVCSFVKSGKTAPHQKKASSSHMVQLVTPSQDIEWVMYVEHVTDADEISRLHETHVNTRLDAVTFDMHM